MRMTADAPDERICGRRHRRPHRGQRTADAIDELRLARAKANARALPKEPQSNGERRRAPCGAHVARFLDRPLASLSRHARKNLSAGAGA
jgi:hypothetical protein